MPDTFVQLELDLSRLDELVDEACLAQKRWGYFAALRRRVTRKVHAAAAAGLFENAERAVRLESCLLQHYFRALTAHRVGGSMPQSWEIALSGTEQSDRSPLQHLLLAMSAHLYLDLGVAAAETMRGTDFALVDSDFSTLNDFLFDALEREHLKSACPVVTWVHHGVGRADAWLAKRGRSLLDESTWDFGKKLSEMDPAYWAGTIAARDSLLIELSWQILSPGFPSSWLLWCGQKLEGAAIERNITRLG